MAYQRKTRDEYWVQQDYGYGDGFEDVCPGEDLPDARRLLKEYRQNQPEVPARIKKHRVRIEESGRESA